MNGLVPPRKVAFYIRVSTERQAKVEEGSLKNQEQMLRAELDRRNAQHKDWGTFVESYVDEGISGKTTNRPAFQRLMQDIELGRIDTVMFTELSRLSRSLKDFLNIFEFAQRYTCDLVCLKTEIDTTSPYQSLVTKILMVFAEFEREMTSRRTALNAYERSKRGLANGGAAPPGYRRDKKRKGYLIVDPVESRIVQEIFSMYLKEQSIKQTVEQIQEHYHEPLGRNITRSKVYTILTNKAYVGVREIYRRDEANRQEVAAVWEPIIDRQTFDQVQVALQKNRDRYNRHLDRGRFAYLFSGLIRCGNCGQRLQGKSAWSSSNRHRYHYYSHRRSCPKGGIVRIDAALIHRLVLGWLRDIMNDGERFERLRQEGVKRVNHRIEELQEALTQIDQQQTFLVEQIDTRINELARSKEDAIRCSIEASITRLASRQEELRQERLYAEHEVGQLEALATSPRLFANYQKQIRKTLGLVDQDGHAENAKTALKDLLAALTLNPEAIKIALSGLVNQRAPSSTLSVAAPPDRLELPT